MIYNLRQLAIPKNLAKIHPGNLLLFLKKYTGYFNGVLSHFVIPDKIDKDFDFTKLATEFSNPVFDGDTKMFDDLALIEEMSRDKYAPVVLEYLQGTSYNMEFDPEAQALNNAFLVFLNEPEQLYKFRHELQLENPKSFTVLRGSGNASGFEFKETFTSSLQKDLDDLYAAKKYGRGIVVSHFHINEGEYFLIRKGLPHIYQPTIGKDLSTVGIYYRPELFDIVIYNPEKNELKIAFGGERKWMRNTYAFILGKLFFGREDAFETNRKMSFRLFEEQGEEALSCLPGEAISLVTVGYIIAKSYAPTSTLLDEQDSSIVLTRKYQMDNFFRYAQAFGIDFKKIGHITGVKLIFHFGPKDTKTIELTEDKCIGLKLDARGIVIEKWLWEHGFIAA